MCLKRHGVEPSHKSGAVITVIRADDALRIANETEYGRSSAVFSRDVDCAVLFARRVQAGMTHVNDSPVNGDANTVFGALDLGSAPATRIRDLTGLAVSTCRDRSPPARCW
jgi:hypothetical protein